MKQFSFLCLVLFITACSNEPKQLTKEEEQAKKQVDKDNKAIDSMERVIKQQIEAISDDSLMNIEH
jgi:starvation-inducible outer membrane lipoprotein